MIIALGEDENNPFTVHVVNSYSHMGIEVISDVLQLNPSGIEQLVRSMHDQLVSTLAVNGIAYSDLKSALTPQLKRREIAFLFDSTATESGMYGYVISRMWLAVLLEHGPEKTAVLLGDLIGLSAELTWKYLDEFLVHTDSYPHLSPELYHVTYFSNITDNQLRTMDLAFRAFGKVYLGYVDCSVWNPLKLAMPLPQFGIRFGQVFITESIEDGIGNLAGYPLEDFGFTSVGIDESLYGPLLTFLKNDGVPGWSDADTAVSLSVLGGPRKNAAKMDLNISESRLKYLVSHHAKSIESAGFETFSREEVVDEIQRKLANNRIFNLRFIPGKSNGTRIPQLDALMFTAQIELRGLKSDIRRYQVGIKYSPDLHSGEIVTFY